VRLAGPDVHDAFVAELRKRLEAHRLSAWVDSRHLARKALAMLDKGEFARYYALSLR